MKKKFIFKILIVLPILSSFMYSDAQVKSSSFNFTLKLLLSGSTPTINISDAATGFRNYTFLDARELNEYNVSHLQNALFVGSKTFSLDKVNNIQKNQPIIVYCSIGKRSEDVTLKLKKAGYTNVNNLYGGIFEWVNQGHRVYNNNNIITDSVHAFGHFWGKWLDKGKKIYN